MISTLLLCRCADIAVVSLFEAEDEVPFSIFKPWEKRFICFTAFYGAMFSTLSSYIYFPALVPMAKDLNVSVTLINLTVTSYLVVAGIAPAFMGDIADQGGRRPAYILMFVLVVGSNIGIALQKSYAVLFVLRMMQSAGSSGTYGAAYGVLSDIATMNERGSYVGSLILFTSAAPSFGPVIAGVLAQKLSWRWIFWFLVILTGTYLLVIGLFLPETQRKIVSNGSVKPKGIHRSLFTPLLSDRLQLNQGASERLVRKGHHIPNPFTCISLLFHKSNFLVISIGSITYTVKMTLQTSLAAQCTEIYKLDYLQAGLIYLPSGVGGALGSYITGKFLDRNIKQFASLHGRDGKYSRGDDISDFPIENARLKGVFALVLVSGLGTVGYGLSLMAETHISVPMVMQFLTGATTSSIFTMCGTLLTDLNPHSSATVQASYNLIRCLGAGAGIASQQPLADATGSGWCFGIYAILMILGIPLAFVLQKRGLEWRKQRASKFPT
ncbi:major facilitator superfamily domain-containing protein [Xylariales sp. AK1849]|nr:major facilitator superfamily domain-containing protein [Xylariales sp. AK1849]